MNILFFSIAYSEAKCFSYNMSFGKIKFINYIREAFTDPILNIIVEETSREMAYLIYGQSIHTILDVLLSYGAVLITIKFAV